MGMGKRLEDILSITLIAIPCMLPVLAVQVQLMWTGMEGWLSGLLVMVCFYMGLLYGIALLRAGIWGNADGE